MKIIKRRANGGRLLHYLEGRDGFHAQVALCGHDPIDTTGSHCKRAGWRNPGAKWWPDCPKCLDVFGRVP